MREMVESGVPQREAARICGVPFKTGTSGTDASGVVVVPTYVPPEKANPGNVAQEKYTAKQVQDMLAMEMGDITHHVVGGGKMGHKLAHESEAPYPESLAEFFIKSFCPPNGTVLDPFVGSGTSICVAKRLGRNGIGIEIRQEMLDICNKRIADPIYESTNDV